MQVLHCLVPREDAPRCHWRKEGLDAGMFQTEESLREGIAMEQDRGLRPPELPEHGREESQWASSYGQRSDELGPLPAPAFICKIRAARLCFISGAESRLFTL